MNRSEDRWSCRRAASVGGCPSSRIYQRTVLEAGAGLNLSLRLQVFGERGLENVDLGPELQDAIVALKRVNSVRQY